MIGPGPDHPRRGPRPTHGAASPARATHVRILREVPMLIIRATMLDGTIHESPAILFMGLADRQAFKAHFGRSWAAIHARFYDDDGQLHEELWEEWDELWPTFFAWRVLARSAVPPLSEEPLSAEEEEHSAGSPRRSFEAFMRVVGNVDNIRGDATDEEEPQASEEADEEVDPTGSSRTPTPSTETTTSSPILRTITA